MAFTRAASILVLAALAPAARVHGKECSTAVSNRGTCETCFLTSHCKTGFYCCPYMKKCIQSGGSCAGPTARCRPTCQSSTCLAGGCPACTGCGAVGAGKDYGWLEWANLASSGGSPSNYELTCTEPATLASGGTPADAKPASYSPGFSCKNQLKESPVLRIPGSGISDWGVGQSNQAACQAFCDDVAECSFVALFDHWCYIYAAGAEGSVCVEATNGGHYKKIPTTKPVTDAAGQLTDADSGYTGCYKNEGSDRVGGHLSQKTADECRLAAEHANKAFFGMEYPQGCAAPGAAQCLLLDTLPAMATGASTECEKERDASGLRLGSGNRLAVYTTDCPASQAAKAAAATATSDADACSKAEALFAEFETMCPRDCKASGNTGSLCSQQVSTCAASQQEHGAACVASSTRASQCSSFLSSSSCRGAKDTFLACPKYATAFKNSRTAVEDYFGTVQTQCAEKNVVQPAGNAAASDVSCSSTRSQITDVRAENAALAKQVLALEAAAAKADVCSASINGGTRGNRPTFGWV